MKPLPCPSRLSQLPPGNRRLVTLMQSIGFGSIEHLPVGAGQARFEPAPLITREIKLASEDTSGSPPSGDFALRRQVVELLEQLAKLGDGVVPLIEVKHGLPFRVFIRTTTA